MQRYLLIFLGLILAISLVAPGPDTRAVSASDWKAGNIISDTIFTDSNSMSVQDIQNFLNQKVGTGQANSVVGQCDTNGARPSEHGGGTRAQWGAARGTPAPYTCLKDYYEVPKITPGPGIPASNYGGKPIPSGAISSAQMIYNAAKQYRINPKVLLVLLQKESAGPLITDAWPTHVQYHQAMGARCPDSTGCSTNYAGFSLQVLESAKLLRTYLDGMDQPWWGCANSAGQKVQCAYNSRGGGDPGGGYKVPFATNFILWSPTKSCGGNEIYMQTKGTTALYTYTPFQPNQAALNNMYGSGDGCSAYGNRNFWRIFSDWFGSTQGYMVLPEVSARYGQLGGSSGSLGIPIADGVCNSGKTACWQQFKSGYIVYSPTTGSWESKGSIREYWGKIGFQNGKLGYPVDRETYAGDGLWWQQFQNGFIIGSDKTGYWESTGKIRDRWGALGYQGATIGLPIDAQVINKDGSGWQQFQNGFILISNGINQEAWESKGEIRNYWKSLGYQGGKAGWPKGSESYDRTTQTWSQVYQKGTIFFNDKKGGWFEATVSTQPS